MRECKREKSDDGEHSRRSRSVAPPPDRDAGESDARQHDPAQRTRAARDRDREAGDQAASGERSGGQAWGHADRTLRGARCLRARFRPETIHTLTAI